MKLFLSLSIFMLIMLQCTPKTEKLEHSNLTSAILKTICLQYINNENDIITTHILSDSTLRFKDRDDIQYYEKINDSIMIKKG
ncbi:MAG: hypothetical protein ACKVLJ_06305 [Cytophagales bacterium]|jgi:hypothetical protein